MPGVVSVTSLLSPCASIQCDSLLHAGNFTLEEAALWPDEVKYEHEWRWSEPLHFADTPSWQCRYDWRYDCPKTKGCVVGAIQNYTERLQQAPARSVFDFAFLVHFVGDISQPLHVGFHKDFGQLACV